MMHTQFYSLSLFWSSILTLTPTSIIPEKIHPGDGRVICHLKTEITHADRGGDERQPGQGNEGSGEESGRPRRRGPCGVEIGMACGAEDPTAKRAKVDEAKEEEDPLVRRREELVLGVANARAKGKELEERLVREAEEEAERLKREAAAEGERMVREAKERAILESDRNISQAILSMAQHLPSVCASLEAKNRKLLGKLPPELWQKIIDENVHQNDLLALAMTCRFFREKQKDLGWKVETNWNQNRLLQLRKSGKIPSHSLGWFRWVCDTFEFLPGFEWWDNSGAVYEGRLLHYAAFQGSVEILRWLKEEKGWELNKHTGHWAGMGGRIGGGR